MRHQRVNGVMIHFVWVVEGAGQRRQYACLIPGRANIDIHVLYVYIYLQIRWDGGTQGVVDFGPRLCDHLSVIYVDI